MRATTIVPAGGDKYRMQINTLQRKAAGVDWGDPVTVELRIDLGSRAVPVPADLRAALAPASESTPGSSTRCRHGQSPAIPALVRSVEKPKDPSQTLGPRDRSPDRTRDDEAEAPLNPDGNRAACRHRVSASCSTPARSGRIEAMRHAIVLLTLHLAAGGCFSTRAQVQAPPHSASRPSADRLGLTCAQILENDIDGLDRALSTDDTERLCGSREPEGDRRLR